jgi:ankyrin repeat protein
MRVPESSVPLVRRTLQWISYATPKLTMEELTQIVAFEEDDVALDPEAYPDPEDLLRSCGSLVRMAHGSLELAHFTVQEFLEAIRSDDERLKVFRLTTADRLILTKTCISYLCLPDFDQPPLTLFHADAKEHKFFRYASAYISGYLDTYADDLSLFARMQELFHPGKSYQFTYFMLEYAHHNCKNLESTTLIDGVCSHSFSTLHGAAMLRMKQLCQWLLEQGCDVNQDSVFGSPLECAVWGNDVVAGVTSWGSEWPRLQGPRARETISCLLDAGAACEKESEERPPMSYAVAMGPPDILARMFENGMPLWSDTSVPFSWRGLTRPDARTILKRIDQAKDVDFPAEARIRLLNLVRFEHKEHFDTSVEIPTAETMTDAAFEEALTYTVRFGHIDAFAKLAGDERFSVSTLGLRLSGVLMHLAARSGSVSIMHALLDHGFDPTILDDARRTVLHNVIRAGVSEKLLLGRLMTTEIVGAADQRGRTVWHEAAISGDLQALTLLNNKYGSHNPWVQQPCNNGYTPILEAVLNAHTDCALLLMEMHVQDDVILRDERILHFAVATGLHTFVEGLQNYGHSMSMTSGRNRTALYHLTLWTTPETLDLLRAHGLDLEHKDTRGMTPLMSFLARDERIKYLSYARISKLDSAQLRISVIEGLMSDSSVAMKDHDGRTAWFYFCTRTVPFFLVLDLGDVQNYLTTLLKLLTQYGALTAYETISGNLAMDLLVKICLDNTTSDQRPWVLARMVERASHLLLVALRCATRLGAYMHNRQMVRLFAWAIIQTNRPLIQELLRLGVDIHSASEYYDGDTAMDQCFERGVGSDILKMLLKHAKPDLLATPDRYGWLKYFKLCEYSDPSGKSDTSKLEALLKAGVDPDRRSPTLAVLAHYAASEACVQSLRLLVRFKADLNLADEKGWTVLHFAAVNGNVATLEYLREQMSNDDQWTKTVPFLGPVNSDGDLIELYAEEKYLGCSLLHLAACSESSETLRFLYEVGCFEDVNLLTQEGITPLHFAASNDSGRATRWLISNGAEVDAEMGSTKLTALQLALEIGSIENVLALVQAGAQFPANFSDEAKVKVNPSILDDLIDLLPDCGVTIPPDVLKTLQRKNKVKSAGGIYDAIKAGDYGACEAYVEGGNPLSKPLAECHMCTPLIVALIAQQTKIAELFLEWEASIEGTPCKHHLGRSPSYESAVEIAISQPLFNDMLQDLLEHASNQKYRRVDPRNAWRLIHIAAAFNPRGIKILTEYIRNSRTQFV